MLGVFAVNGQIYWSHLLFVSTFLGDWGGILNIYWFIECLTWCVAALCLLATSPTVRRFAADRPLAAGLTLVGAALGVRLAGAQLLDAHANAFRSPDQMFVYFAAGWMIALAGPALRLALFGLLVVLSALAWGWTNSHVVAMSVAACLIVFVRRVPLPALLGRAVATVAAASFYIYLANIFPMYVTDIILDAQFGEFWLAQIAASLALGIGGYFAVNWIGDAWNRTFPRAVEAST
jgi:hypothetical protein